MTRIEIVPYRPEWPDEFALIGQELRNHLGDWAIRIDHIGSTSVPGLSAKDIIDIQITVDDFDDDRMAARFEDLAYTYQPHLVVDHEPPGRTIPVEELEKRMVKPPATQRPTNVHIRRKGSFNQRYALLFRDYLRTYPEAAAAYGHIKAVLSDKFPIDIESYYDVKDPVIDVIMAGAWEWADRVSWAFGPSDA